MEQFETQYIPKHLVHGAEEMDEARRKDCLPKAVGAPYVTEPQLLLFPERSAPAIGDDWETYSDMVARTEVTTFRTLTDHERAALDYRPQQIGKAALYTLPANSSEERPNLAA